VAAPASAPVEPPAPASAPASPRDNAIQLVEEAKQRLAEEKWLDAYAAAEKALAADPKNDEAKKIEDQAHAEFANEQAYKRFTDARDAGKIADAVKAAGQIPKPSVYRDKADGDVAAMHAQYLKEREAEARTLAAKGQCDKVQSLARRSADVFADAKAAVEHAGARCTPAEVAEPTPPPVAPVAAGPMTDDDAQKLIQEGREAALNSNWTEARKKADIVLKARPDDQDALSIAGIAACNLVDKDRALRYMKRLRGMRQNQMQQICASRGLFFDE
jgi:hypothetical protein